MRYIVTFFIVLLIYYFLRKLLTSALRPKPGKHPREQIQAQEMVKCDNCGKYVAANQAINRSGNIYCSEKCVK